MLRLMLVLIPLWFPPQASAMTVCGELKVKRDRIVRLCAKDAPVGAALLWDVVPEEKVDAEEFGGRLYFTAPPGVYQVKLRALVTTDGKTEVTTARATVVIEGETPVPVPPAPKHFLDPVKATGKLRFGNSGCTATVIAPRRSDGRWDVLTASHCTGEPGSRGSITLKDGRTLAVTVTVRNRTCDLSWMTTDDVSLSDVYYANLAPENPAVGVEVWHEGYGIDRPTNHEAGTITGGQNRDGQLRLRISVSSGDSGSGFFRKDTGELVSVVCCGSGLDVWGGSVEMARSLRPGAKDGVGASAEVRRPRPLPPPIVLPRPRPGPVIIIGGMAPTPVTWSQTEPEREGAVER